MCKLQEWPRQSVCVRSCVRGFLAGFFFAFLFAHYIFLRLFCIIEDNVDKTTNENS